MKKIKLKTFSFAFILSLMALVSCIIEVKEDPQKAFFTLDAASVDTSKVDEITILGVKEGTTDTVAIYRWTKGEVIKEKLVYPASLTGKFKVLVIQEKNNKVVKAVSVEVNDANPDAALVPKDIPQLLSILKFEISSPGDNKTVANKSITISGTIESESDILFFKMNGKDISANGKVWFENVELTEGANTFIFYAVNKDAKEIKDTLIVTYSTTTTVVDADGPIISTDQKDGDTVSVTPFLISGSVSDLSGILSFKVGDVSIEPNGNLWSKSIDLVSGKNQIILTATDNTTKANVTTDTLTLTLNTVAVDNTKPVLSIGSPKNGDKVSGASLFISGTATDNSNIASVTVDGDAAVINGTSWSKTVTLATGLNAIIVIATDNSPAKNLVKDTLLVTYDATVVDTTAPSIAITSPSNNTTVGSNKSVAIAGTASDLSGIKSVTVNGIVANVSNNTWNVNVDLAKTGDNTVTAIATDSKDNTKSTSITIKYDSTLKDVTKPTISYVSPSKTNDTVATSSYLVQVKASDAQSGINSVSINGAPATLNGGNYESTVTLDTGSNGIKVIAEDKSTNKNKDTLNFVLNYKISTKNSNADLSGLSLSIGGTNPSFSSATTLYTLSVANSVSTTTITPTLSVGTSTVKVNGNTVSSGSASAAISLSVGNNAIPIIVTAENGATKTYTITITRASATLNSNADLSALTLSAGSITPTFAAATTSYTLSVANSVTSTTVTPTVSATGTSTVTVNGSTVTSASVSAAIILSVGVNTVTIVVTSESGITKTYTVNVTRSAGPAVLVSYWDFNEGTGTALADKSANGHNGTISAATWVDGINGKGLKFSSSIVDMANTKPLDFEKMSIVVWAKFNNISSKGYVFCNGHDASAGNVEIIVNSDKIVFQRKRTSQINDQLFSIRTPAGLISLDTWYNIVATYDRYGMAQLYINGTKVAEAVIPSDWVGSSFAYGYRLGRMNAPNNYSYFLKGTLDEARVYNGVLSSDEITAEWNKYKDKAGLVAYYPFTGNANDASGANNGTVTGATLTNDRFGLANNAYDFKNDVDKIVVPNSTALSLTGDFSFSFWVNIRTFNGTFNSVLSKMEAGSCNHNGYFMGMMSWTGENKIMLQADPICSSASAFEPNVVLLKNQWYHIGISYDLLNSKMKYYSNGILADSISSTLTIQNTAYDLLIGNHVVYPYTSSTPGNNFDGQIDDIRIYNRVLGANEFQSLYSENGWTGE